MSVRAVNTLALTLSLCGLPCGITAGITSGMIAAITPGRALAQPAPTSTDLVIEQGPYEPWIGDMGVRVTVQDMLITQAAMDAAGLVPSEQRRPRAYHRNPRPADALGPFASTAQAPPTWTMGLAPANVPATDLGTDAPQALGLNFTSNTITTDGVGYPSASVAVGPNHIVTMTNGRVRAFDKSTGALQTLNLDPEVFFATVLTPGSLTVDTKVRFDKISNRFFAMTTGATSTTAGASQLLIAVSNTSDPNGSWTFFGFVQSSATPAGDTGAFADFATLAIDADALYIGANMFSGVNNTFSGTTAWVVRKSSILGPGPIAVTAFRGLVPNATGAGPFTPRGVDNPNPSTNRGYIIGVDNPAFGQLSYRIVTNPGGTPSLSGNLALAVPSTSFPSNPSNGGTARLRASDDRLHQAAFRRNRITNTSTLWTAHQINVDSAGMATSSTATRNAVRWYEIRTNPDNTLALVQSGTLFDNAATNPKSYLDATIAMSGQGHVAIGASISGVGSFPSAITAGRLNSDPLGTIQPPLTITNGTAAYAPTFDLSPYRWGVGSATVVDPTDDQSFWTVQQFASASNAWGIRVARLLAPPPATITAAAPATLARGQSNTLVALTGTSTLGSGFYDTEPTFNRLAVTTTNPAVTINSITWISPTQINLNLSVNPTAPLGPVAVIVTNPDGQSTSASVLSITPAATCYPNCDGSTTAPVLGASDISCFLSRYRAGDPYANCDSSTTAPVLGAADFSCFLNRYRGGC